MICFIKFINESLVGLFDILLLILKFLVYNGGCLCLGFIVGEVFDLVLVVCVFFGIFFVLIFLGVKELFNNSNMVKFLLVVCLVLFNYVSMVLIVFILFSFFGL